MRRAWFQDDDGTYRRNCPLIMAEQDQLLNMLLPWRYRALKREWRQAWRHGVIRSDTIGRRDHVVTAAPFREAYPDKPGLWSLDEERTA
ncbi:hypothetical protein [Streptomyces canus]|uniref:hypothetical protein n=1 Tax=Streptomyces canus TaxID=58343 RepID=UPI000374A785|nr:hypothetical protein [Streptomyces canus]